jgi:signal transduction histidine kinase
MKIASKFALAFSIATALSFFLYAYVRSGRELMRLEAETRSELHAIGELLSTELSIASEESSRATQLAAIARSQRRDLIFRYAAPGSPHAEPPTDAGYMQETFVICSKKSPSIAAECGSLLLALREKSTMEVLREELREELVAVGLIALLMSTLAFVLGDLLVTRPLERLITQAKRVGAGDFSVRLREDRRDELGDLKRELNIMCEHLDATRTSLEAQTTAQVETLEQLRHLDRLRSVGTVASSLAHELGTPLNVLLLRGQAMLEGEAMEPHELVLTGQTIVSQVEKMSRLVRELLHFSRAQRAPKDTADIATVATGVLSLLSTIAKKHKVELRYQGPAALAFHGNPAQLEQALTNLVINGIQAMPTGGKLTLQGKACAEHRRPHSSRVVSVVQLDVCDEGHGIAEERIVQIFEPFYTTKSDDIGTGLGLTVSKGIIDEHNGWITATSKVGHGSVFSIFLPVHDV